MKPACLLVVLTWLLPAIGLAQAPLRHNLFAQPKLSAPQAKGQAPAASEEASAAIARRWPRLSSVLSAGDASIAVLDGVLLRLNESVGGYRLVRVGDRSALLSFKGEQMLVHMNGTVESVPSTKPPKEKP
jgi:hypothetical protein